MKTRRILWAVPVIALAAGGLFLAQRGESAPERQEGDPIKPADLKPAVSLPISQVILFNSGVGHFTRSGDVEGFFRHPRRIVNHHHHGGVGLRVGRRGDQRDEQR